VIAIYDVIRTNDVIRKIKGTRKERINITIVDRNKLLFSLSPVRCGNGGTSLAVGGSIIGCPGMG
jgi:hypothetical protein